MSMKSEVYKDLRKKNGGPFTLSLFLHFVVLVVLIILNFDQIKYELFDQYDVYSSLSFSELIEQGYDEDDSLLNALDFHEEICSYIKDNDNILNDHQLISTKEKKTKPLKGTSIVDFSKDNYSYRLVIGYEKGIISTKCILFSWNDNLEFPADEILSYLFNKANIDITYHSIEEIFEKNYKKNWGDYNQSLGEIKVRIDNRNHQYICFVGNEKKSNNINQYIEDYVSNME